MKWTKEQENVIYFRDRNILVSAAAGSGKTAVLVERIIQKITDPDRPVDIDRLLVVTFTHAAAAEMKERIGDAIEKRLEENPEDENLRKQQTLLHNAQITTIDSFCLFVVRNHFEEIGIEPNFRIADSGELQLLETDVLDEVFEREYARTQGQDATTSAFLHLTDAYSAKTNNKAVKEMVAKIYKQSSSSPWPKEWIAQLAAPYRMESVEELLQTAFLQNIYENCKSALLAKRQKLEQLQEIAFLPDGPNAYGENILRDLEQYKGLDEVQNYRELEALCKKMTFTSLNKIMKYTGDPEKKAMVQEGRNAVKKEVEALINTYFSLSLEEMIAQFQRMRPVAEELVRLSLVYLEAMDEKKEEKHLMSFSDVEHCALKILVDEKTKELRETALEFQSVFEEIMIDEYQDSNQVQEAIMCAISKESRGTYNMFMVGDVKQSIYRFRLARPELFMEKYATYEATPSEKQRIDLHKNFRSRAEVLDFTNDIFYKIMAPDLGSVVYDADAALYCGAEYPESTDMAAEVLLFENTPEEGFFDIEEAGEDWDSLSNRQLEASMVATRITELMENTRVTIKGTQDTRPLRYSDIVILLRSVSGWGAEFVSVLEEHGIPAHVATSTGYFSAIEVQTILSFLRILDNPYQDIPMAAVLKSPIVGLDEEELAELALKKDACGFADAVLKEMNAVQEGKLYRFHTLYQRLRGLVCDTPIHQLIEMVLDETGYGDYVTALPAGKQRKANLEMLIEKAIAYEKTSYKGLFHFVRYIDRMQKYEVDFGEADVMGEGEDVVRISTIHKSKGLEFPVVFVSGLAKGFNKNDVNAKMVLHADMGLGLDEMQLTPRIKRKCLIRNEIAERIRRDDLGEQLRILYVALTRAKEKLILTGVVKNQDSVNKKYTGNVKVGQALDFEQRSKANCFLDWVVPAVLSYPDKYKLRYVTAEQLLWKDAKDFAEQDLDKSELLENIRQADRELTDAYRESFAYRYPYQQDATKKSKYSVSELKRASMLEAYDRAEGEAEVPEFLLVSEQAIRKDADAYPETGEGKTPVRKEAPAADGAVRGTAVHRVMECLDFAKLLEIDTTMIDSVEEFVSCEIKRMLEKRLITEEMEELVCRKSIVAFLMSPIAKRMAVADAKGDLFTEKPFVMDYEGVLLQGIIDVFWLEEDGIVLMDYKTDRVKKTEELVERYRIQLNLYANALSKIFGNGQPCTTSYIYSFALSEVIPVPDK